MAFGAPVSHLSNPLVAPSQLSNSSSQADGIPADLETSIRFAGARLTQAAGVLLGLSQDVVAQAIVLYSRFWVAEGGSLRVFGAKDISAACLYLIAKLSPNPQSPRNILNVYAFLVSPASPLFSGNLHDAPHEAPPPDPKSYYLSEGTYFAQRASLFRTEAEVLRVIGFQTHIALPYTVAINYLQALDVFGKASGPKLSQRTFAHLTSALLSPQLLYLTHQPPALATAAIYLSARDLGVKLPAEDWWEVFDVDREELGFLVVALRSMEGFAGVEQERWQRKRVPMAVEDVEGELEARRLLDREEPFQCPAVRDAEVAPGPRAVRAPESTSHVTQQDGSGESRKSNSTQCMKAAGASASSRNNVTTTTTVYVNILVITLADLESMTKQMMALVSATHAGNPSLLPRTRSTQLDPVEHSNVDASTNSSARKADLPEAIPNPHPPSGNQVKPRVNKAQTAVETAGVKHSMNPFDELSIEESVRIRERKKVPVDDILAFSAGPAKAADVLRTAMAMGADRSIHVEIDADKDGGELEPLGVAKLLKAVVEQEKTNLVILGKQSIDDDAGQTGQMLAGLLGWSQATQASRVEFSEGNSKGEVTVTREVDGGVETLRAKLPMVITTDLRLNEPRYASLPNIMKAKKKKLEKKSLADYGVDARRRLKTLKVTDPPARQGGGKVEDVDGMIAKLKELGAI